MTVTPLTRARTGERSADPVGLIPFAVHLDYTDTPADVADALALAAFTTGRQPYARTVRLARVRADATLVPDGARLLRAVRDEARETRLAAGDGWTLHAVRWSNQAAAVTVTAVTDELARTVVEAAVDGAAEPPAAEDVVPVGFWHFAGHARRSERPVNADAWAGLRGNYAPAAAAALDRLTALRPEQIRGRLILLYGPPGTGKTTVLRTLAREWSDWCQLDYVLDPERLFTNPGYLMSVAIGHQDSGEDSPRRWRLLLLEDCDELIHGAARQATGQALSRLLNLTDGLLGQGRDVLVAITTNEDLARLHPAVVRPGRCLARIEVGPLPYEQATRWLGEAGPAGVGPDGATLAELYALRAAWEPVTTAAAGPVPGGGYV